MRPSSHWSRTSLCDEDIIGSNMTMPTTSIPKVQPFYMRLIIDAFDELMLHMMCVHSHFQNYLHGSREGLIAYGKHGRLIKLIGDQIQVFLMSSARPPGHFGSKDRKSPSPTRFGS